MLFRNRRGRANCPWLTANALAALNNVEGALGKSRLPSYRFVIRALESAQAAVLGQ